MIAQTVSGVSNAAVTMARKRAQLVCDCAGCDTTEAATGPNENAADNVPRSARRRPGLVTRNSVGGCHRYIVISSIYLRMHFCVIDVYI